MKKYEDYKDPEKIWLGEIPRHWDVKRIKHCCYVKGRVGWKGLKSSEFLQNGYAYLVTGTDFKNGKVFWDKCYQISQKRYEDDPFIQLENEDLLITKDGTIGKLAIVGGLAKPACLNSGIFVIRSKFGKLSTHFLYWILRSNIFSVYNNITSYGSTIQHLYQSVFVEFAFPVPPLSEQIAIINFLNHKCALIDQAIAQKERMITMLTERRQILIQQAVTRGLDPNVEMKDSGVEWIGKIPKHWEVVANRTLFSERKEPGNDDLPLLSVSIHSAVSSEELDEEQNIRSRIKIQDRSNYKLVEKSDIVFNMMRAWQGAIGAVIVKGMVSPAYIVAQPNPKLDAFFFEYQYRTSSFIQQMNRFSKGITDFRKRLYWNEFKQLSTILPPKQEQFEIVEYIEEQSSKVDTSIELLSKQIGKLKEYKAVLINSAVTGKIKVN